MWVKPVAKFSWHYQSATRASAERFSYRSAALRL